MIQRLKAPLSVYSSYNHKTRTFAPAAILWEGRKHTVQNVGYHHTYREGRTLFHVFSVMTAGLFFRLVCNTDNLSWEVHEIADEETN